MCGERAIADTTLHIPHPYPDGAAEAFIARGQSAFDADTGLTLALEEKATGALAGAVSLRIERPAQLGELGYWVRTDRWNRGYATEAARAMLAWGFGPGALERVQAQHLARNPASGRVMAKLGMQQEGVRRGHVVKWGVREDLAVWGILKAEFVGPGP